MESDNIIYSSETHMKPDKILGAEQEYLPARISRQIDGFVDGWGGPDNNGGFNCSLPEGVRQPEKAFAFLRHFYKSFVADRNKRAKEVNADEYKEIFAEIKKHLPMMPFFIGCMDGRVKFVHEFGFSAHIGGGIRVPGGSIKDFVRGTDGQITLKEKSNFAINLDTALKNNGNSVTEVMDSHWACAARKKGEGSKGRRKLEDEGLFNDVLDKKEMAQAIHNYLQNKYGEAYASGEVEVLLAQETFNPITGFLYMGLERDEALAYAREVAGKGKSPVYSKEVLSGLIASHKIISTGALLEDPRYARALRETLESNNFAADWKDNYVETAKHFWEGVGKMKDQMLPILKKELVGLYPQLGNLEDAKAQRELEERAMLLLCNLYNGYLHNPKHVESKYLKIPDKKYKSESTYAFDTHWEEGIKISEGGYPPYDIPMFVIFSGDEDAIPESVMLAEELVRDNRTRDENPIIDRSGNYTTPEEFGEAPVAIVMQEIVRAKLGKAEWEALEDRDWSNLPKNWDTMTDSEFQDYLLRSGELSGSLIKGLNILRRKMAKIYTSSDTRDFLLEEKLMVMPVICGQDRETHAIIPFAKHGFRNQADSVAA
jgi:hypothetical protein